MCQLGEKNVGVRRLKFLTLPCETGIRPERYGRCHRCRWRNRRSGREGVVWVNLQINQQNAMFCATSMFLFGLRGLV